MKLKDIYKTYPNRIDCINLIESIKFSKGAYCPYCTSNKISAVKNAKRFHCNNCNTTFSVTVGTAFHKTKVDLQKWFFVIGAYKNKNYSARALSTEINVTKDTALLILNKISKALSYNDTLINNLITKFNE